ncbi:hypothetical protein Cni_G18026 [Canna indica]|uniref:DUF4378 domain-containing protein n=1 Tax=Canna indica TaxID=4628 RepID=A0AAQ3KI37_9LILI|nr:hypothetical protein Cni_G18026 [Canna indica]
MADGSKPGAKAFNEHDNPGCMQSLLHFLDLHQRLRMRKTLVYRRHSSESIESPKRKQNVDPPDGCQNNLEKDANVVTKNKESAGGRISSPNALMRNLISRKKFRGKDKKQNASLLESQMLRTLSIHHLEGDVYVPPDESTSEREKSTDSSNLEENHCSSSNELIPTSPKTTKRSTSGKQHRLCRSESNLDGIKEAEEFSSNQNAANANELGIDAALYQSKEFIDMMQLFSANRELFLKFLKDPTFIFTDHAQKQQASVPAKGLTKSGSFPVAGWLHRNNEPSVDHLQEQNELVCKKEKNLQNRKSSSVSNLIEDVVTPVHLMADRDFNMLKAESSTPDFSELFLEEPNNKKNVITGSQHFKLLKKKIKDIIKEHKREEQRISMDSIIDKIPCGEKFSENVKKESECRSKNKFWKSGIPPSSSKHALKNIRKSTSFTESLCRYSQLLESVSSTESKKTPVISNSIKEDTEQQSRRPPKALSRIFSLPELRSRSLSKDTRNEVHSSQLAMQSASGLGDGTTSVDHSDHSQVGSVSALSCNEKSLDSEKLVEQSVDDVSGVTVGTKEQTLSFNEQEHLEALKDQNLSIIEGKSHSSLDDDGTDAPLTPGKILDTDPYGQEESLNIELNTLQKQTEDPDLMIVPQLDYGIHASLMKEDVEEPFDETPRLREPNLNSFSIQVHEKEEAEFQYVRNILHKSGFSSNPAVAEWYLPDVPVDPSLFEEECSSRGFDFYGDEPNTILKHMLLFDLINEVLLETYDASVAHCPWVLHSDYQIRPLPVGHRVVEEVWAVISKHLSYQLQLDQTVESIVERDFTKNDGWMSLQHDIEFVGLDMGDLILEDLFEEIILDFVDRSSS